MLESDRLLLSEIERFSLVTMATLLVHPFAGRSTKAVERILSRNVRFGRIRSRPLYQSTKYYSFTPKGARRQGLSPQRFQAPFGTQALCQNYCMLSYARLSERRPQARMTKSEFAARFPKLVGLGLGANRYYVDSHEGTVRLSLMVPDFDSHARRLARKVRREVVKRRDHKDPSVRAAYRSLLADDNFGVTVLTAFDGKAERIERDLRGADFYYRVEVVPGLLALLGG